MGRAGSGGSPIPTESTSLPVGDHIQRKYAYAYAKRWIDTSEQFIEYIATKSGHGQAL